jgi:hypothetical protein
MRTAAVLITLALGTAPAMAQHTGGGRPPQGAHPQGQRPGTPPAGQRPGAHPAQTPSRPGAQEGHAGQAAAQQADPEVRSAAERAMPAVGRGRWRQAHRFDDLPAGGRIAVELERDDPAGVAAVRGYVRELARAFGQGKYWLPGFGPAAQGGVGTARAWLRAEARDLPRGAELVWSSPDSAGVAMIRQFLRLYRLSAGPVSPPR